MSDRAALDTALTATARGDRAAFAELYRATAPQLFALAIRMLRRRDLAEEAGLEEDEIEALLVQLPRFQKPQAPPAAPKKRGFIRR